MKLTTHHLRAGAALLLAGVLLAGCDQSSSDEKHIKVGVINGAEQDVAEVAKKVAKEKYGLDVELVGFSGSLLPNDATNHGELDANVFQHRPFLEQDNQAHGYKLVAVGNTFVFPMAGYSKKIKTVAQIKEGATVAIPNDPTNGGRVLLLLQSLGLGAWVALRSEKGLAPLWPAWRLSLVAGSMGAAASLAWFTAYAMQGAAEVRTLGMVEVVFSYLVSRRLLSESFTRPEKLGMALMLVGLVLISLQGL